MNLNIKIVIFSLIIFFLNDLNSYSQIYIKAKVNDQIITNHDIENEIKYLVALNPKLKKLNKKEINRYAIDSAINETVKKIEIEKFYKIVGNNAVVDKIIKGLYSKLNITDLESFIQYLDVNGIDINQVKNKIGIEVAWNDLIVNQFANSIKVNEKMIKEKINIQKKNTNIENLLLSEIIFTINDNNKFQEKYSKIKKSIDNIGFEETARIYSVSNTKNNGGNVGWIYKNQLSKKIVSEINKINVGEYTNPITTSGGFIIIMLNEVKNEKLIINEEEQFKKAVLFERDKQLKRYSTLHYKRVFNKTKINEF
jgi:peptidyl-prolyl cis-trans isomerase SurA